MLNEFAVGHEIDVDVADGANVLSDDENANFPMYGILRHVYSPERKQSRTVFVVLREDQLPVMEAIVDEATGGLEQPDTGIAFAVPLAYQKGLTQNHAR